MAQKIITSLVDDLDGNVAVETVPFALDGKDYEIDLSAENASKLREGVAHFVAAARNARPRAGATRRGRAVAASVVTTQQKEQNKKIREWALGNGFKVSDRGRIPADVVDAYNNAN